MNHYVEYLREGERRIARIDDRRYEEMIMEEESGYLEIRRHGIYDEDECIHLLLNTDPDEPGLYKF